MKYIWEQQAKRNEPMPGGLSLTDQMAYQTLAELAARYKMKAVSAEQAKRERAALDRAYATRLACDEASRWSVELRKRIEIAHAKYRKDPTLENAKLLSDVIDGFVKI